MYGHAWNRLKLGFIYLLLGVIVLFAFSPYAWVVVASFKTRTEIFSIPPVWIFKPTIFNYVTAFIEKGFLGNLVNSLVISLSTTFLSLAVGVPSAYAFARYRLFGDHHLFFFILTSRMAPPVALALPLYLLMKQLGILNTHIAVVLAHTTFNLALVVWLMRGFFKAMPREMEEAALIDGCSVFAVFWRIALPVTRSGLATVAIFCIIMSWNEFLFAMLLAGSGSSTLTVVVPGLLSTRGTFWGQIAAVVTVLTLPVVTFTFIVQKHLVRGLTFGAVKG